MGTGSSGRVASAGLQTALAAWVLSDRAAPGEGSVRAVFKRRAPAQRLEISYALKEGRASLDAGAGRVLRLSVRGEDVAGDPSAWTCDCPAGRELVCLHAALAARGLAEDVEAGAPGEDEAPDPSFACALEAPSGMLAAAERSRAALERVGEGIRVLGATVTRGASRTRLRLPHGRRARVPAPAAGGRLGAGPPAGAPGRRRHRRARPGRRPRRAVPEERAPRAGEQLPPQDVERFRPIVDRADALVAELLTFGLQRMTKVTLERVDTLVLRPARPGCATAPRATPAWGGWCARWRGCARCWRSSWPRVTTTELDVLHALAVVRNLGRALRANTGALPLIDFAGPTQQEYEQVPVLDVQGLGFEAWVTPTGFAGTTVYVADCRTGRIYTRSNTLPEDLASRMAAESWSASWADQLAAQPAFAGRSESYLELARSRFLLSGALLAQDSGACRAAPGRSSPSARRCR